MAPKKERLGSWKDRTQRYRNHIVYGIGVLALLGTLAGWALLPEQVRMTANPEEAVYRAKESMLAVHLGMTALFTGLFWRWPRELIYLVGAMVSLLLIFGLLSANLGG
ncbi:MAG: hypothetical protein ACOX7N_04575 [Lawsonibacter sp.]